MSLMDRMVLATSLGLIWLLWVGPGLSQEIQSHQMRMANSYRPEVSSESQDTGENGLDEDNQQLVTSRSELLRAEEERTVALWKLLSEEDRQLALKRVDTLPPLPYEGDARFVEKETPSLVRITIDTYGFQSAVLPQVSVSREDLAVNRAQQMKSLILWVQEQRFSDSEAEQILGGALDLLKLQQQRMEIELNIQTLLEETAGD
jgi:hypothetical protein